MFFMMSKEGCQYLSSWSQYFSYISHHYILTGEHPKQVRREQGLNTFPFLPRKEYFFLRIFWEDLPSSYCVTDPLYKNEW